MTLLGKLWSWTRRSKALKSQRRRKMFFEPLEGRQLLAADLRVVQSDNPDPVAAGTQGTLTYTITIVNDGADDAQGVQFNGSVPSQTTFSSFQADSNFTVDNVPNSGGTGSIHAFAAQLLAGQQAQFV